jgi:hypothetical protein
MKLIICQRDGKDCDLDKKRKACRHIDGTWAGKCIDRREIEKKKERTIP